MNRASDILRAGGRDPSQVCRACGLADADLVPVRPAPPWMERLWVGPVEAMTLPGAIYVAPRLLAGEPDRLARLVIHEMVHVAQWRRHGRLGFLRAYLTDYLRGRRRGLGHSEAYDGIRLEIEARRIVDSLTR